MAAAVVIIKRAEEELRAHVQRALDEGRYADVAALARLADGLAQLATAEGLANGPAVRTPREASPRVSNQQVERRAVQAPTRSARGAKAFPRFEREADKLVKIAWSKKDRSEYEHKAPLRVVNLLIDAIRSKKGEGSKFTTPDVLPLIDSKSRGEIPSYQSYLALGWLRHEGVIVKYGRDTYSLKPTAATAAHLKELWEALPSRD